jgi:hypothetical protein
MGLVEENVEPSFGVGIYEGVLDGWWEGIIQVELLAEAGEMRGSDTVRRSNQVRHVKSVESGSGAGFGRIACDGIPTDLVCWKCRPEKMGKRSA